MINLIEIPHQDKKRFKTMLQQYLLDLFPDEDPDYPYLDLYWEEADRHAFYIQSESELVGFVLINRIHSIAQTSIPHSIAEFAIFPGFRKKGYGSAAAIASFVLFPGNWEVQVPFSNTTGLEFWRAVIHGFTKGQLTELEDKAEKRKIILFANF